MTDEDCYYVDDLRNKPIDGFDPEWATEQIATLRMKMASAFELEREFLLSISKLGYRCEENDLYVDTSQDEKTVKRLQDCLRYGPWPPIKKSYRLEALNNRLADSQKSLCDLIAWDAVKR